MMLHSHSSKLALRALAVSVLLCLGIFAIFGRSTAADSGFIEGPTTVLTVETAAGSFHYDVELAVSEAERERGLMNRRTMAEDHGMLFDMGRTAPAVFWMHDTLISLDIIFIDADGRVVTIAGEAKPRSDKFIESGADVRYVLELNAGRAKAMRLEAGDVVRAACIASAVGG
jgi:uncharacterized protein